MSNRRSRYMKEFILSMFIIVGVIYVTKFDISTYNGFAIFITICLMGISMAYIGMLTADMISLNRLSRKIRRESRDLRFNFKSLTVDTKFSNKIFESILLNEIEISMSRLKDIVDEMENSKHEIVDVLKYKFDTELKYASREYKLFEILYNKVTKTPSNK